MVASAAIDLAAEGLPTARQLAYDPDPITRFCLTRTATGALGYFTWGECEFLEDAASVLAALAKAALAAGTITAEHWATFAVEFGLDQPRARGVQPARKEDI